MSIIWLTLAAIAINLGRMLHRLSLIATLVFLFGFLLSASAFPFSKRPTVGEQPDNPATPNERMGPPTPRNVEEPNRSPPTGAEPYGLMKKVTDPQTGKEHLVPVDPKDPPPELPTN